MKRFTLSITAVLLFVLESPALAQSGATGTIIGSVTDTAGGLVANASVTITNLATNVRQQTITSSTGTYSVPFLTPGNYQVSISTSGFSTQVVTGIVVEVGKEVAADVQLKPGATTESVTVTASPVALDTANSALGHVITERQILDLPLNGRNFTQLLLLGSGAVQNSGEQGSFRRNVGNALTIQGAHPGSNRYMLDGISINDIYYQTPSLIPSIDALQEFQEQTKGYSAAYGYGVNQINLSTKSGANAFHGTVYEFLRNDALDARSYFDSRILPLRQNQFGYTAGGPVWIPRLYNGRNKTFFFANYEGIRATTSSTGFGIVPTPAELSGVFPNTIINPKSGLPYPNNTIPASEITAFGSNAAKHYPAPNVNVPQGNYQYTPRATTDGNQQLYRFDHSFNQANSIFGRYSQAGFSVTSPAITAEGTTYQSQPTRQVVVGYTHTFAASAVNQLRFGWLDAKADILGFATSEAEWSALGLAGTFPYSSTYTMYPSLSLRARSTVGGPTYTPNLFHQPAYQISDAFSLVKGSHSLSMGIDINWAQNYVNTTIQPTFSFDGSLTGYGSVPGAGHPVADLLLGYTSQTQASVPTEYAASITNANSNRFYHRRFAPWIQDDWKVNSRFTVNMGVRWDFSMRPTDERGNMSWLNTTIPGGGLYIAAKQLIDQGLGGTLYQYGGDAPGSTQWRVFAPRMGFAYRPSARGNTVLRASFGIFFDSFEAKEGFTGSVFPFTFSPIYQFRYIQGLFPTVPPASPVKSSDLGFSFIQNPMRPPYVEMWNFSVQHLLPLGLKLEASYLGSAGHQLMGRTWPNAPRQYDPNSPTPVAARVPYPNLGLILDHPYGFNSNYNALDFRVEHRGRSLTLQGAYTWSHSLDIRSGATGINNERSGNGPMNQYNWHQDYGSSAFDVRHRFVASFVYALPFGKGQAIGSGAGGLLNQLISDWQTNGILVFRTGFPFSVGADDLLSMNQNFAQRANVIGNPSLPDSQQSITQWFNTAAFAQPVLGAFGNSGRNILTAPGSTNFDFSIFKSFRFAEYVRLQTRFEAFNVLNHANFGAPNSYIHSSSFGVIGSASPGRIIQIAMKFIW